MSELAVLADMYIPDASADTFVDYRNRTLEALKGFSGFNSITFWQNKPDPSRYLVVSSYASKEAAAGAFVLQSEAGFLIEWVDSISTPANVHRMVGANSSGRTFETAEVGSYLSASYRMSEPGFAMDLQEELNYIFQELKVISGFLGAKVGPSDTVPDEVVGIVFWANEGSFNMSIPKHQPHEVLLYQKVL